MHMAFVIATVYCIVCSSGCDFFLGSVGISFFAYT